MNKDTQVILIVGVIILIMFLFIKPKETKKEVPSEYTAETAIFDFSKFPDAVQQVHGNNNMNTIKKVGDYVFDNIKYDQVSMDTCYIEKASNVILTGRGDCASMSKLAIALLRGNGVPARPVGGCGLRATCNPLLAVIEIRPTIITEITNLTDIKKRGGLHEWVEAWDGNEWVVLEATSGMIYDTSCNSYIYHDNNEDAVGICQINEVNFLRQCMKAG